MKSLSVQLHQTRGIPLNVKFSCAAGEVLAIVGPSGSGKTTVLRAIAGLMQAQHGKIRCRGETWYDTETGLNRTPQQRHVGMVFQDYALFPHLSVRENIRLALSTERHSEEVTTLISNLLARVNLHGLEDRKPAMLSGGQQQRVALARALARTHSSESAVLLLDEPFSAVDQVTRRKLRLELKSVIRELDMPIILVTHDLDEAALLADRLCVLHNGESLQIGSPEGVLHAPKTALIARLVDVRNIYAAEVIETDSTTTRLRWAGYTLEAPANTELQVGDQINWCIHADKVLLHRRVQPSRGVRENPVHGKISECLMSGGQVNVVITLDTAEQAAAPSPVIHMDLPRHVLDRNPMQVGEPISMSLLKSAIHLMPKK